MPLLFESAGMPGSDNRPPHGLPESVQIMEVGPRDGLQNEATPVTTETKRKLVEALVDAGLRSVEVTSFVRGDRVPQLADSTELFQSINRRDDVRYVALVPNPKGLDRALEAGCTDVAVFTAASETFNQRNINRTIDESLDDIRNVVTRARENGLWVRGYISTAFGCPYEGPVSEDRVRDITMALLDTGIAEVSIGDTIGVATPGDIDRVLARVLPDTGTETMALHLHDTRGTALANVLAGLLAGITIFDSSAGGLGGCPFAPGATGNLATDDLVYMLDGLGIETGVDPAKLRSAVDGIADALRRNPPSAVYRAPPWPAAGRRS